MHFVRRKSVLESFKTIKAVAQEIFRTELYLRFIFILCPFQTFAIDTEIERETVKKQHRLKFVSNTFINTNE